MKKTVLLLFALCLVAFTACGPEHDAREICECYTGVIRAEGEEATKKMGHCDALLRKYEQRYKDSPEKYATFQRIYDACR